MPDARSYLVPSLSATPLHSRINASVCASHSYNVPNDLSMIGAYKLSFSVSIHNRVTSPKKAPNSNTTSAYLWRSP